MRYFFTIAILLALSVMPIAAQSSASPDFAFPAKVAADSRRNLDKAIRAHNDPEMLRALIDLTLAGSVISPDTLRPAIDRIDSIAAITPTPATRSLLRLIQATIISNAYSAQRWKYDRRQIPAIPLSSDYTAWSGTQFRTVTDSLLNLAIADTAALKATPISSYSSVINAPRSTARLCPNLLSFIILKSIDIRKSMLPDAYLPLSTLSAADSSPITHNSPLSSILKLYDLLLTNFPQLTPPSPEQVEIEALRINFIASHIYPSQRQESETERNKLLLKLFLSNRNTSAAPYALLALAQSQTVVPSDTIAPAFAAYLRETISRYPSFYAVNCLRNTLTALEQPEADITSPQSIIPGEPLSVKVNSRNLNELQLILYRIDTPQLSVDSYYSYRKGQKRPQIVSAQTLHFNGTAPFVADTTVEFTLPEAGQYIIVPQIAGRDGLSDRSFRRVSATHFALGLMTFTEHHAIVVNQFTGEPITGAQLKLLPAVSNPTLRSIASTDKNGMATIPSDLSGNLFAEKDKDIYAEPRYIYPLHQGADNGFNVEAYTDLPLYHPGDSVGWVAIVYSHNGKSRQVEDGRRIRAVMNDANHQPIDTFIGSTDPFGRITGKFVTPKEGLTGQYSINFSSENEQDRIYGNVCFTISDYKLPTFQIVVSAVDRNTPIGGATITGSATTYSGMPVSNAEIMLSLSQIPRFGRFYSPSQSFYSLTATTDSLGKFSIPLEQSAFTAAPTPDGVFSANITVTSLAGESREISRIFSLGKSYAITANPDADIEASSNAMLNVNLINSEGTSIKKPVNLTIYQANHTSTPTARLTIIPGEPTDLSHIPSGIYNMQFSYPDADTLSVDNIAIYRLNDKLPPRDTPIWVPSRKYTIDQPIVFGTSQPTSYVLITTFTDSVIVSQRWMKFSPGIHTFTPEMKVSDEKLRVNLLSTNKYRTTSADITVTNPTAARSIKVESSTFRDRLLPGSTERWTLTVKAANGAPASAALVLDVYDAAIRQLTTPKWTFNPYKSSSTNLWITAPVNNPTVYTGVEKPIKYLDCTGLEMPEFDTYGLTLGPNGRFAVRRFFASAKTNGIAESKIMKKEVTTEEVAFDMAAPAMAGAAADGGTENGGVTEAVTKPEQALRSGNIPLALFRPTLTTDADGRAVCTFTLPNANTTWSFNAIAFTRDLLTSSFSTDVIASKPIMVTPNPPRFMRMGDTAIIPATVSNATDSTLSVTTVLSTFNASSNSIIATDTIISTIPAGQSTVVNLTVNAPTDETFIGFRAVSSVNGNSDGEQLLIPLLPASTPVIESSQFYLAPGDTTATISIPASNSTGHTILTYCDNPLWYAVTALPGLTESKLSTSTSAAVALFSAAASQGLLNSQPLLAQALREWSNTADSDSMLTSMLSKNSDLKELLLSATPWVEAASSDSERMARLALLFDSKTVNQTIANTVKNLSSLQMPDGGLKWSAGSSYSSEWATHQVLKTLGRLNTLNMLPKNEELSNTINRALTYLEAAEIKRFRSNPSGDFTAFASLTTLWPNWKLSTDGSKIKAAGINSMLNKWKNMDVKNKIEAATTLYKSGYQNVATKILESVRQYALTSPNKGMWWPTVTDTSNPEQSIATAAAAARALNLITPQSSDIDLVRQWLIYQKQAMNWGTGITATEAVAAILTTSPSWIYKAGNVKFTLCDKPLDVNSQSPWTGDVHMPLPTTITPNTLVITRTSGQASPAWGAVTGITILDLHNIPAHSQSDISITKRMYALAADGSPRVISDDFTQGNKVRVELTITIRRAMDYVVITDERAAGLEPVDQLPGMVASDGAFFYRENLDTQTNLFIDRLPAGTYILTYDTWANNNGTFASGIATIQSQLNPTLTAHSSSTPIHIH